MDLGWYFGEHRPGDKVRDPIQGEFFSTDAIRNPAEALIRESFQNSLDATREGEKTKIRIFISGTDMPLDAGKMERYFNGSWNHFMAEGNGLRNIPKKTDPCNYLVIEDFGTTGLTGDVGQWMDSGVKNLFFYFFRAEGRSAKGEMSRGRWGVGKYVFPRSSKINSFFAVTVRDNGEKLLMGQSVLKSHSVGGNYYKPDGFFGIPSEEDTNLILPSDSKEYLDQICKDFNLKRRDEHGLSIIVPWNDTEIDKQSVLEAILRDYFYPILTGNLVVTIDTPSDEMSIDNSSIISKINNIGGEFKEELLPLVKLANWGKECPSENRPVLGMSGTNRAPGWTTELIPDDLKADLQSRLQSFQQIGIRVPIQVTKEDGKSVPSYFDVFLVRSGKERIDYPVFIREGIIISDNRKTRVRGILSMVLVEDKALATMLGDSENPAHTQWQKDGSNFKGKYKYGPSTIDFVIKSVSELVKILTAEERKEDPTILADIFSIPASDIDEGYELEEVSDDEKGEDTRADIKKPESKPKKILINKTEGGFTITSASGFSPPALLDIKVAYLVRRGNPLKNYDPLDFKLDSPPVSVKFEPANIKANINTNQIKATIITKEFKVSVAGFDINRDLYINASVKEVIK